MSLGPSVTMSLEEAHLLRDLFAAASGFLLRDDLSFIAERRLAPRLEVYGLRDFGAYARFLKFDPRGPEELETAIELLVPHETYFFREPVQLESVSLELLPRLVRERPNPRTLSVWSAGCSTGEEPYTLSMILLQSPVLEGWDIDVLGTDLSRRAIASARRAEYGPTATRATTASQRSTYFDPLEGGKVRVKEQFRSPVRFGQLNLIDASAAALLPRFDLVFCRNVLMYFDQPTRRKVVELFFERLVPGGYLLLGHSENLLQVTTRFELVQLQGDLVYRRPS